MPGPKGFEEYRKRAFCNDVKCPVQRELNTQREGTPDYELIRKRCSGSCFFTAWQFHHWLIERGFIVVKPEKPDKKEREGL